jgi:hypothetical protein
MSDWLYLGLNAMDFASKKSEAGVSVSNSPSPYDVPEAARLNFDEPRKHLFIEFQYIGSEPVKKIVEDSGISFRLGKNSGRLYGIEVELEKINNTEITVDGITGRIAQTIGGLAASCNQPARTNNYIMVQQAVTSEKASLFAEVNPLFFKA